MWYAKKSLIRKLVGPLKKELEPVSLLQKAEGKEQPIKKVKARDSQHKLVYFISMGSKFCSM